MGRSFLLSVRSFKSDLFSFHPFFLFAPFAGHPSSDPFLGTFFALFSPQERFCSVELGAQHRAWKGAFSGGTSPQISGRKCLPEIRVKKGQFCLRLVCVAYGRNSVWSFLLTVENGFVFLNSSPYLENGFGLSRLQFPLSRNWVWSFLLTSEVLKRAWREGVGDRQPPLSANPFANF